MMLNMILPTAPSLSRPASTSPAGETQAGEPGSSNENIFAQLLLQAGSDMPAGLQPASLQTATLPWPAETELGDRQLLAQMIAEHNGLIAEAPITEASITEALRNASGEGADRPIENAAPPADLPEGVELTENAAGAAHPIATADNVRAAPRAGSAIADGAQPTAAHSAMQPAAAPGPADVARHPNPLTVAPSAPAANLDVSPALSSETPVSPSGPEPASALVGQAGATINTLAAAQTPQPPSLNAPLNTPAWGRELGQQVAIAARGDDQHISLRLNPANLGPLQIELKVLDQQAHIQFLSPHAQVRGAVEQAIPQLREALAEQGITLADTSVDEQRQQQQQHTGSDRPASHAGHGTAEAQSDDAMIMAEPAQPLADGRINVYV